MRLDKFICKSSEYSLPEALALIEQRRLVVNDQVVTEASHQVHQNNVVTLDAQRLIPRPFRYFLLHKPIDMICSNIDEQYPSVFNLLTVNRPSELHIAGRLDADTTGLVLITDDGHWSYRLTSPKHQCEKVYKVELTRPLSADAAQRFQSGILLQGEAALTRPARLQVIDPYYVYLTLTEGRFHQVKRMFAAIGNRVKALHRQQIGSLSLDVKLGDWRSLTTAEVKSLAGDNESQSIAITDAANPTNTPYS
ncbi:pseudouridine synthase [Amphritea sp. 2_MG-2023]|uniref:pseudouridine synthase n=1 Tax=Amphritea TaxID=515417 RepID=UPI001C0699E9|nr:MULTISPECIES: pseudouridine synthase [Amphritea]MBU2966386.1 pseudouridine synthase [Amphritea atlantica]MDO6419824.1 pseudouridine synthase [Amphritea sp. 2_MG-2023]